MKLIIFSATGYIKKYQYRTIIRLIVMYGCEGWTMSKHMEEALRVWERKILRKVYGPKRDTNGWRIHQTRNYRAVPWLKWLVAGLSPRRPGFAAGSIHVGFVVDKVALEQVFLRVLRFLCRYHSTVALQTHTILGMTNMQT
jgi:hypothetical protein